MTASVSCSGETTDKIASAGELRCIQFQLACAKFILEFQNDALGQLFAHALRHGDGFVVLRHNSQCQLLRRDNGQDRQRRLRAHARHTEKPLEAVQFLACGKAEDVEGILLDVAVGEKFCRLSQLESGKRIICCMTRIAHAAAVHNREIGVEQRNCPVQIIKHYRYPFCARSEVELRAWQSAMAMASAASSGRATFSIFRMRRVISMT